MSEKQIKTEYSTSTYQTGSTMPPKSYRGLILILLGIVIFLGGIVTALGVTNIRLFQALSALKEAEPEAVHFSYADPQKVAGSARETGLGFSGETVSEFWHTYHRLPRGIFIQAVEENSDAARQGVLPGDILIQVNSHTVTAFEDLEALLEDGENPIQIVLYRDGDHITLQLHREK